MALPDEPLTRTEQYLNRTATGGGTIPDEPLTRAEMYLNKIATGSGDTPEQPLTRMEQYLDYIAENGGGGGGGGDVERVSWRQCPEAVREYLANVDYDPSDYSTSQIANYAPAVAVASNAKPIGYTTGGVTYYNEVPNEQTPFANSQTAGTLEPLDRLRWINCPTVNNVRDLGGWTCDGGTVKYGMLIRGGEPTAQDAAVLVGECGVKFEMNLRGRPEAEREYSILGNIGYAVFDTYAWYSIADTTLWRQMMRAVFDAVNNSIPVYFHCGVGLDRTGTFACILEALLGMSQSDCDKEYELSCFSTGTDTDQHARRRDEADWRGLIDQINAKTGSTFRDKVVNFVLSLGFSISEINRFRAVMTDGTPEILVGTYYTVTNTLTGVTNSNAATSVEEYQPYVATITADSGYTLDGATVQITMGGADVSQYYSNGTINIPSVTGDIAITATAVPSAPAYTNWIKQATAEIGGTALYNGMGYKNGWRLNSSGAERDDQGGTFITGYIPVQGGDTVYFYGDIWKGASGGWYTMCYTSDGTIAVKTNPYDFATAGQVSPNSFTPYDYDSANNVLHSFTIPSGKNIVAIRFTLAGSYVEGTSIVTVNEEAS